MADARLAPIQARLAAGDPDGARSLADTLLRDAALATGDRTTMLHLASTLEWWNNGVCR